MSDTDYPQLDQLVNNMKNVSSIDEWDVACSYTIDRLNAFLAAHYAQGKLASHVKSSTTRRNFGDHKEFIISYDIRLGSPTLSFIAGRSGFATLSMPIDEGSFFSVVAKGGTAPAERTEIPGATYTIRAVVPLAAVNGDTGTIADVGDIVTFSDTRVHENAVIVHFRRDKGATFSIHPQPQDDLSEPLTSLLPVLEEYFKTQVSEVDYALASVNNRMPSAGATVLTPASFVFTTMGEGDTGVLSVYVQTRESGNPPGSATPFFKPGGRAIPPIPHGRTASIILANSLVRNGFIAPQLRAGGFTVSFETSPEADESILARLGASGSVIASDATGSSFASGFHYDGLDVSLDDHPLYLALRNGELWIRWNARTMSNWSDYVIAGERASRSNGVVDLTITVNKGPIPLVISDAEMTIADVTLTRSDFEVEPIARQGSWVDVSAGFKNTVPAFYTREMTLQIPSITLALHGLDYFATTNLLAPGAHIIAVDSATPVQTPHDLLLVGDVRPAPVPETAAAGDEPVHGG
jgi:hypothetical protein